MDNNKTASVQSTWLFYYYKKFTTQMYAGFIFLEYVN